MRLLILTIALVGLTLPAFANCGADHQASGSATTTASNPPSTPAPAPASGG
jgi:hypothetical protein